jgi:tetratricopeptide (TPR) repeat protein
MSEKRLAMLEKMTAAGSKDPFAWYGLAMEYAGMGRLEDALVTFQRLHDLDATYVPMYLMCGTMLAKVGRVDEARSWFTEGVERAEAKGDSHALSELQEALATLG